MFLLVGKGFAAGDALVKQEIVNFSDLNVSSSAGVAALYRRIHRVARGVCYVEEKRPQPALYFPALRCAREAEAQAVADINIASLTAYYQAKTGHPPVARAALEK
jgi:UrcA family protein